MSEPADGRERSVFDYLDFRAFLADWFEAKKEANPRFSHRVFARLAGQRSPSLLHHVITGQRNLTPATVESFARAMKLGAADSAFFARLVELGQAETEAERNAAWERIAATRRFREARQIEGAAVEYVSTWYFPAVRELAYRDDFVDDAEWVARTLRPRITAAKARRALDVSFELGLLTRDDQGAVRPSEASVVTPHEVAGMAAHNYHQGMLERAIEAIATFEPAERHFSGLTVAVPAALVPRLKQEIAAFQEHLLNLCDAASDPKDRVYQIHCQLFPLSEPREPR